MSSCNDFSVIASKLKPKYFMQPLCPYFTFYIKMTVTNVAYFLYKIQDPILNCTSVFPTSELCLTITLVLLLAGN